MHTFIFDIDGTLIDSVTMYLAGLQRTLRRHGREFAQDDLRFSNGIPSLDTMTRLGYSGAEADAVIREWTEDSLAFADAVDWFPGMKETVAKLRETGKVGIVTSKNRAQFTIDNDAYGFGAAFDTVVTAGEAPRNKPFGDPILLAMKQLGGTPATTVYVGDTLTDAKAAHDAQVPFALATWTTPRTPEFEPVAWALTKPADLLGLRG